MSDQIMHLYFLGDEEGPDAFGLIYDDEDEAKECAVENELTVWRVPVTPHLSQAERIYGEEEDDEPCYWIVNNATEPAWCCNTHMYDGTGDYPAAGEHPETCPFREEE